MDLARKLLHKTVREELERLGLPYSVEPGKKHFKLYVAGRMIGVISQGTHSQRQRVETFAAKRLKDIRKLREKLDAAAQS